MAIEEGKLGEHLNRAAFIRESVAYFEAHLPRPTTEEYSAISKAFCDKYPVLRTACQTKYWVMYVFFYCYYLSFFALS